LLEKFRESAERLHEAVRAGENDRAASIMDEINGINYELTPIKDHFSRVLSDGSRWLESKVLGIFFIMVIIVETTGLTLTVVTGREIAGIASENARLLSEATKALRLRDEFLSVASHELRTPLTALGLQLYVLQKS